MHYYCCSLLWTCQNTLRKGDNFTWQLTSWKPHHTLLLSILPIPLAYSGSHTLLCCSPSYLFHQHIVEATPYYAALHPTYSTSIQWKPHPTLLLSILPIPPAYSGSHTLLCCSPSYLFLQHIVEATPYSAALHPTYPTSIQWKPHHTLLLSILPISLAYSRSHNLLCYSPSYLFHQHIVEATPYSAALHPTYSTSIQWKPHPTLLLSILPIPLAYSGRHTLLCCSPSYLFHQHIVEATPSSAALHPTYSTSIQWKPHPTMLLSILPIPLAYSGSHTLLCCSPSYLFHQHIVEATPYYAALHPTYSTSIQWKPHPPLLLSILPIPLAYSGSHTLLCCSPSYLFHQHIVEATPYSAALHPTYSTSIQWKPHPTMLLSILPIPLAYSGSHTILCYSPFYLFHQHIVEATSYSAALHPTYSTSIQWKPHPTLLLSILPISLAYSGSHTLLCCSPSYLFHQHIVEATPYSAALHPTYSTSIQWKPHPTLLLSILPIPLAYSGSLTILCCSPSYIFHQHIVEATPYSAASILPIPLAYSGSHTLLCCSPSYLFHQHIVEATPYSAALHPTYSTSIQWKPHPTLLFSILPIPLAYSGSQTLLCCSPSYLSHQHIVEATPSSAALHPTYSTSIQWNPHPTLLLSILPISLAYSGSHTLLCCSPSYLFHQHIVEATPYSAALHPTYSTSIQWKPHPTLLFSILPIPLAYSGSQTILCCSPSYLSHQHIVEATPSSAALHPTYSTSIQWNPHPTLLLSILPIPLAYSGSHTLLCCSPSYLFHQHIVEATPYSAALHPTYSTSIQWKPHPTLLLSILPISLAYSGSHALLCCSPSYLFRQHIVEAIPYSAALHPTYSTSIQWKPHPTLLLSILPIPLAYSGSHTLLCCSLSYLFHQHIVEATPYSAALHTTYPTSIQWKPHPTLLLSILPIPLAYSGSHTLLCCSPSYLFRQHIVEAKPSSAALHLTYSTSISGNHPILFCSPSYLFHQHIVEATPYYAALHPTYSTSIQWKPHPTMLLSILPIPLAYSGSHTLLCCSPSYLFHQHIVEATPYSAALHPTYSTSIQWKPHPTLLLSILLISLAYSGSHTLLCCSPSYLSHQHIVEATPYSAALHPTYSTSIQWKPHPTLLLSILPIPLAYSGSLTILPLYASGIGRMESSRVGCGFHYMLVEQVGWRAAEQGVASTICQWNRQDGEQQSRVWLPLYASEIGRMESSRVGCGFHYMLVEQVGWRAAEQDVASTICQWNRQNGEQQSMVWLPLYASGIGRMESSIVGCGFHYMLVEQVGWRAAEQGVASTICQWNRQDGEQHSRVWLPLYASGIGRMESSRGGCGFHYMLVEQVGWRAAQQGVASTICQWNRQDGEQHSRVWLPLYASGIGRMESSIVGCGFHYMLVEQVGWRAAEEGVASTICQWNRQDGEQQSRVCLPLYASGIGRMESSRVGCGFHYMLVEQVGWRAAEQGVASTICQWNRQDGEQQSRLWLLLYASEIGRMESSRVW